MSLNLLSNHRFRFFLYALACFLLFTAPQRVKAERTYRPALHLKQVIKKAQKKSHHNKKQPKSYVSRMKMLIAGIAAMLGVALALAGAFIPLKILTITGIIILVGALLFLVIKQMSYN